MSTATRITPEPPESAQVRLRTLTSTPSLSRAYRVQALCDAHERLTRQITAQRAVLELAQAQGDEEETETALVLLTLAVAARAVAQGHLERLGNCAEVGI